MKRVECMWLLGVSVTSVVIFDFVCHNVLLYFVTPGNIWVYSMFSDEVPDEFVCV